MQYSTREEKNYILSLLFISCQRTWFKKLDGLEAGVGVSGGGIFSLTIQLKLKKKLFSIINFWNILVIFSGANSHNKGLKVANAASGADTLKVYRLHTDTWQDALVGVVGVETDSEKC